MAESGINQHPSPESASATAYVDALFSQALERRASDLHLEPQKTGLQIRLRIDGLLHELPMPPPDIAQRLCARIKIMARLDIAERRLPQDGRISVKCRGQQMDLRVSSLPTLWGEKLVLRIVLQESSILRLKDLGLEESQQQELVTALAQPQGVILVTGPTGSGKTLTLYSALQTLNQGHRNISTAEEPVEIPLVGVNQVAIKPQIGLTFSSTLRALLRQDPDVLMVGEIRDADTASMAIRAAQTGHLVLSTVHTKSAQATLVRMRQLGIGNKDLEESVTLVMAQRLLRRLCNRCKIPDKKTVDQGLKNSGEGGGSPDLTLPNFSGFRANSAGCPGCLGGYQGRLGIFELCKPSSSDLKCSTLGSSAVHPDTNKNLLGTQDSAISRFVTAPNQSLRAMALRRYAIGETTLEEIERVLPRTSFTPHIDSTGDLAG